MISSTYKITLTDKQRTIFNDLTLLVESILSVQVLFEFGTNVLIMLPIPRLPTRSPSTTFCQGSWTYETTYITQIKQPKHICFYKPSAYQLFPPILIRFLRGIRTVFGRYEKIVAIGNTLNHKCTVTKKLRTWKRNVGSKVIPNICMND